MYCVRCKKNTKTTNEQIVTTSNNRQMKRGKVCNMWNNKNAIR